MPFRRLEWASRLPRRRPALAFGMGLAALLATIFADPLLTHRTFAERDLVPFFLPIEKAVHDAWRRVEVPLCLPEVSFGRPLAANPNTGAFYPGRTLAAAIPFRLSFKLFPVLHLWLAGMGAFLLARLLSLSGPGAGLAGMVFALCGPALSDVAYPNILPGYALAPWLIWAAGRFARDPSRRAAALFGALWGADLLAGDVFTSGLALFGAVLLAWQESEPGVRSRIFGGLALAASAGFLLAAIQIVPALLLAPLTVRVLGSFTLEKSAAWSLSPWRLAELILPFPFGHASGGRVVWGEGLWSGRAGGFFDTLHCGSFAALSLLLARPARGRRLFLAGFGAFSLAAAAAGAFLPDKLRAAHSPLPLRYPEKLAVGAVLTLALLAGMALDRLSSGGGGRASRLAAAVALALLAGAWACSRFPGAAAVFVDRHWSTLSHLGALAAGRLPGILGNASAVWALLAGILFLGASRPRALAAALLAFTAVELSTVRAAVLPATPEDLVLSAPPSARAVRRLTEPARTGFLPFQDYFFTPPSGDPFNRPFQPPIDEARRHLSGDTAAAFGIFEVFNEDYDVSDLYRVELARRQVVRAAAARDALPGFLPSFSAGAAILQRGHTTPLFPVRARDVPPAWVLADPSALPLIRLAPEVLEVRGAAQSYAAIRSGAVDLSRVAVVESGRDRRESFAGGRIKILTMAANRWEVETSTASAATVVLARAWTPFVEARVDGRRAEALPANLCWTSVAIPSGGRHRLSLLERLPGGVSGPALSACGLLLLLVAAGEPRKRAR
jgi:hypothetical protein